MYREKKSGMLPFRLPWAMQTSFSVVQTTCFFRWTNAGTWLRTGFGW
jgi:hypothetical protein